MVKPFLAHVPISPDSWSASGAMLRKIALQSSNYYSITTYSTPLLQCQYKVIFLTRFQTKIYKKYKLLLPFLLSMLQLPFFPRKISPFEQRFSKHKLKYLVQGSSILILKTYIQTQLWVFKLCKWKEFVKEITYKTVSVNYCHRTNH